MTSMSRIVRARAHPVAQVLDFARRPVVDTDVAASSGALPRERHSLSTTPTHVSCPVLGHRSAWVGSSPAPELRGPRGGHLTSTLQSDGRLRGRVRVLHKRGCWVGGPHFHRYRREQPSEPHESGEAGSPRLFREIRRPDHGCVHGHSQTKRAGRSDGEHPPRTSAYRPKRNNPVGNFREDRGRLLPLANRRLWGHLHRRLSGR